MGRATVELHSLLYQYAKRLSDQGATIPALAVAGGFTFEDQIFKGLSLGAPFVKLVGMAEVRLPQPWSAKRSEGRSARISFPCMSNGSATQSTKSSSPQVLYGRNWEKPISKNCRRELLDCIPTTNAWPKAFVRSWPGIENSLLNTSHATTSPH